jgi:fatty-acid peroxygenase
MNRTHTAHSRLLHEMAHGAQGAVGVPALTTLRGLWRDPYRFISRQCRRLGEPLFRTRLPFADLVCMTGHEAATVFYDGQRFMRQGAAPEPLRATLFGKGGVQGLDGAAHRERKALFLDVLGAEQVTRLAGHVESSWARASADWLRCGQVELYSAVQPILTEAVCRWAGVPVPAAELGMRTAQMVSLFDEAASWRHLHARHARHRAEAWLQSMIEAVREGRQSAAPGAALRRVAEHRDSAGQLLPPRVAAVDLLNLLRPTVAVSVFIVWVAYALHAYPAWCERLREARPEDLRAFTQEVRRLFPFFAAVMARAREDFSWHGHEIRRGDRVMLDLYGTNHDPAVWPRPYDFQPGRFLPDSSGPFKLVPQGGGLAAIHHRCPGEDVALRLMELAAVFLASRLAWTVPVQDLGIAYRRLPALPRSRFVIRLEGYRAPAMRS